MKSLCKNPNLGEDEFLIGRTFQGSPDAPELLEIMLDAIESIHMHSDGVPKVDIFPNHLGAGGHGVQIYQVLTESWIIGGTWPVHGKTRVVLSSCKPYDSDEVIALLEDRIGPMVKDAGGSFTM
jgi:S-adenosylmethionine/arginine decarboxylase-like enzyme